MKTPKEKAIKKLGIKVKVTACLLGIEIPKDLIKQTKEVK